MIITALLLAAMAWLLAITALLDARAVKEDLQALKEDLLMERRLRPPLPSLLRDPTIGKDQVRQAERMAGVEVAPVSPEERQRMAREQLETGRATWKGQKRH